MENLRVKEISREGRRLGWPSFLYEAPSRVDSCSGESIAHRGAGGSTLAESPSGVVEIAGHVIRRCRIYGNLPPRQVLNKVFGASAVVVNDDGIVSLLCEKLSDLIDQSPAAVWHKNLLAQLR